MRNTRERVNGMCDDGVDHRHCTVASDREHGRLYSREELATRAGRVLLYQMRLYPEGHENAKGLEGQNKCVVIRRSWVALEEHGEAGGLRKMRTERKQDL